MHHEYTVEVQEKMQVLRDLVADLREECAEKDEQIEKLRKALTEIAEWTDMYTSPGHPVSTVAQRALTGQLP